MAAALRQTGAHRIYLLGRRRSVLAEGIQTLETSPHPPSTGPSSSDAPDPGDSGFRVLVPIECDVTSPSSISAAATQIEREKGFVDVLINNAGIIGPVHTDFNDAQTVTELQGVLLKDWDGWAATMATNASSVVGVSATFLPLLDAANRRRGWEGGRVAGHGHARQRRREGFAQGGVEAVDADDERLAQIITVASVGSYMRRATAGLAYNASKAAAAHLGKMLATMLAEWGVRSNVIAPGLFHSAMTTGTKDEYGPDEIPVGRKGSEQDIAGIILFLVGKGGAYINGSVQISDGGRLGVFPAVY
jgi:THO complex subunit 3